MLVHDSLQDSEGTTVISGAVWQCNISATTTWCSPGTEHGEPFVMKLDRNGDQVWLTKNPYENFSFAKRVIQLPGNNGYIVHVFYQSGNFHHLFRIDENGQRVHSDQIDSIRDIFQLGPGPKGFSVFFQDPSRNNTFVVSSYSSDGNAIKTTVLQNITRSNRIIVTGDGDYRSVHLEVNTTSHIPTGIIVYLQEVNPEGEPVRDRQVTSIHLDSPNRAFLRDAIATKDGGLFIVLGVEKSERC